MGRTFGIFITLLWLACMAALMQRDVLPYWQAQDPPDQQIPDGSFQVAVTNGAGKRVGTTWINTIRMAGNVTVHSTTQLDLKAVSSLLPLAGDLYFDAEMSYGPESKLETFVFRMETAGLSARVKGTRYDSEFACIAQIGKMTQSMALDGEVSRYLGDSLRPFTHLEGLRVGQTWRLRLIDPMALLRGTSVEFTTRLVKVTARETIVHGGMKVECFRIEMEGAVAWADEKGLVLRQEVQVPLLGRWVMTDEPYNDKTRLEAKRSMMNLREDRVETNRDD